MDGDVVDADAVEPFADDRVSEPGLVRRVFDD